MKEVYSVTEFCEAYRISKALFYKLLKQNKAPVILKIGRRTLISKKSAEKWMDEIEEKI